jgi:phosphate transport system permease protein
MVIGNATGPRAMVTSLFQPGQTLPSLIANGFIESPNPLEKSAYVGAGLVLLVISIVINVAAYLMVTRLLKVKGGAVE